MPGSVTRAFGAAILVAASLAGSVSWAVAARAAIQGWRVVAAGKAGVSSMSAVTVVSRKNVWASGSSSGRAFVDHWTGRQWRKSPLPSGLSGSVMALSASAWNNVWAFGAGPYAKGEFALRDNGHGWRVMKRWPGETSISSAIALSPRNVWVFSFVTGTIQHFNGSRWSKVQISPFIRWFDSARALPDGQIWAIAEGPQVVVGTPHPSGYTWTTTPLTGFPSDNVGGHEITDIAPLSASNVWAFGGNVTRRGHWYPLAAHWNGQAWKRVNVTGSFTLSGGASASDGHGGLWVTMGWGGSSIPPRLLHFVGGKFAAVSLPRRNGKHLGVFGLAHLPGSRSVWGVGTWTGPSGLGAPTSAILKYGR